MYGPQLRPSLVGEANILPSSHRHPPTEQVPPSMRHPVAPDAFLPSETAFNMPSEDDRITTDASDPAFTDAVIAATGDRASKRLREVMPSLIRHLHNFAREVDLTVDEWLAGVDLINQCGQMSNNARNETQLLCDVLGLESLVDEITTRLHQKSSTSSSSSPSTSASTLSPTPSTILGPFYRLNAPLLPPSSSIIHPSKQATYLPSTTHLSGRVLTTAGIPIPHATLDIWHAAPNGMYEQQDPNQPDMDLRGILATDVHGAYSCYCLRPVSYPIPDDGPVGRLLARLDRHPHRPAHIHVIVSAPGFRTLTTQLFDAEDAWLADDAVFAVRAGLVVQYVPRLGDASCRWAVEYDFVLVEDGGRVNGSGNGNGNDA